MRRFVVGVSFIFLTVSATSSPLERSAFGTDLSLDLLRKDTADADNAPANVVILEQRETYNCTDLKAPFDSRCWRELGLSGFLMDPTTGWNHTVRMCSDVESAENNDGSDCCKQGEPWTTCFLRLAHGTPGQDCSQINSQFCSYQSDLDPSLDISVKPEIQYIMKNIYGEFDLKSIQSRSIH